MMTRDEAEKRLREYFARTVVRPTPPPVAVLRPAAKWTRYGYWSPDGRLLSVAGYVIYEERS